MATTVRGTARNVRWENVPTERRTGRGPLAYLQSADVVHEPHLQFRVEQVDETGNPTEYVSVVASASSPEELPDFLSDGDEVAVTGRLDDGLLDAHELTNLTTETTVTLQRRWGLARRVGWLVLWLATAVFLLLVGAAVAPTGLAVLFVVVTMAALAAVVSLTESKWVAGVAFVLVTLLAILLLLVGPAFV